MEIKDLKKIAIIAILGFLLVGFAFFRKDTPKEDAPKDQPKIQQPKPIEKIDPQIAENEKLRRDGEIFAMMYNSFSWGDFSNIESLYPRMTVEMQISEKGKIEESKKKLEDQPKQYLTWRANLLGSKFISSDKEKATLAVYSEIDKFAGAIVQKDTFVWVDKDGKEYKGDEKDLIVFRENKETLIDFVKIGNEWKMTSLKNK